MNFYDIELIDKDASVDNFKFNKVSKDHLLLIKKAFENNEKYIEFVSKEGNAFLATSFFRGMFYSDHRENLTALRETVENSIEISKIKKK